MQVLYRMLVSSGIRFIFMIDIQLEISIERERDTERRFQRDAPPQTILPCVPYLVVPIPILDHPHETRAKGRMCCAHTHSPYAPM